jgi:hypothetical protein
VLRWRLIFPNPEAISKAAKLRVLNGKLDSIDAYRSTTGELVGIYKVLDAPSVVRGMVEAEQQQRVERDESIV